MIFICTNDPFESGLPVYTFERKCREDAGVELKDEAHHLIFNASAYEQEEEPELRDFLAFVRNNTAESDFTRGIANMVQTKKFEQTFINEYLAWNLHDKDVELRGPKAGICLRSSAMRQAPARWAVASRLYVPVALELSAVPVAVAAEA